MLAASSAAARGASDMRPSGSTAGMGAMKSEPLAAWRSPILDGIQGFYHIIPFIHDGLMVV